MFEHLYAKDDGNPHTTTDVRSVADLTWSATAFYRDQSTSRVNLGFDLSLVHRTFQVDYGNGGLGGGYMRSASVELDQLYVGLKPEVHLNSKRNAVFRFGLMAGFLVAGKANGSTEAWSMGNPNTLSGNEDFMDDFRGDYRAAFGFGFRAAMGTRWAITFDPEATIALSSMLKEGDGLRGWDFGLSIGLSRRSPGKGLSALFKADQVERNAKPSP